MGKLSFSLAGCVFVVLANGAAALAQASGSYAEDRAMIENLMSRYIFAFDWRQADAYAATFTEDGELNYAGGTLKGREALRAMINQLRAQEKDAAGKDQSGKWPPRKRHIVTSLLLDISGNKATARAYWAAVINDNPERHPVVTEYGHYEDELIKQNGRWLFTKRRTFNETVANRIAKD
jgi:hypothetical protein